MTDVFTSFKDIYEILLNEFKEYNELDNDIPPITDILQIFNNNIMEILDNIDKLKSSDLPLIDIEFITIMKSYLTFHNFENNSDYIYLCSNTELGSPLYFMKNKNSIYRQAPEIVNNAWKHYIIAKIWYDKLLELGYKIT
jgi:hypothetical protein